MNSASVIVKIRCEVELPVGKWGSGSSVDSLAEIAKREGVELLQRLIKEKGGRVCGTPKTIYVIGVEE